MHNIYHPADSVTVETSGSYYDWAWGKDGWARCYQYTPNGWALNQGYPVGNALCEAVRPSRYHWARGNDGYTRCYQVTPDGYTLNQGYPVANSLCE